MGNRAVITTIIDSEGIYLHWNGGRDSVEPFLAFCKLKGFESPEKDRDSWNKLKTVIGNFFGDDTSVEVGKVKDLPIPNDNGYYLIRLEWDRL